MTTARQEVLVEGEVGVYHCISRCVRRAWLCGEDPLTGAHYDHRKCWVRGRLEFLTSLFGVELAGYSVMSNHLHLVLRTRPDRCRHWPAEEVAQRWCTLFPHRGEDDSETASLQAKAINTLAADTSRISLLKERLSSVSWFMRCLNEWLARRANQEDHCSGRFWEGRFKCQALLDDAAVLACMAYVDLNPIRAKTATSLEESYFTSVQDRIQGRQAKRVLEAGKKKPQHRKKRKEWETRLKGECQSKSLKADWLVPFEGKEGILPLTLDQYLELLDWSGRQIARGKAGRVPGQLAPVLERLEVDAEHWLSAVQGYGRMWHLVVGTLQDMAARASRCGRLWLQGRGPSGFSFSPG